jgi:hypothetical protein
MQDPAAGTCLTEKPFHIIKCYT